MHKAVQVGVALWGFNIFEAQQTSDWSGRRNWYNWLKLELTTEMLQLELVIHGVHVVACSTVDEGEKIFQNFSRDSSKDENNLFIGDVIAVVAIDRQKHTK